MRVIIEVDSATTQEVYNLTLAFQRTKGIPLPPQLTDKPTVTVAGTSMGWRSPAMHPAQVTPLWNEFQELQEADLVRRTALS